MLISEVIQKTGITKKAIEYYTEQGLIHPVVLENGYRDFSLSDLECLEKISLFRKLGISVQDIKAIFADETGEMLRKISVQRELGVQKERAKKAALDKLCRGQNYSEISADLAAIEQSSTITEKLLEAFPGYYGRFVCLHFARFLNDPIKTEDESHAYSDIIAFLDNVPPLIIPEDMQTFLDVNTMNYDAKTIRNTLESTKKAIENLDTFLSEHSICQGIFSNFLKIFQIQRIPFFNGVRCA